MHIPANPKSKGDEKDGEPERIRCHVLERDQDILDGGYRADGARSGHRGGIGRIDVSEGQRGR